MISGVRRWLVYALPFGLFIAKISRGRTIRQMVLGGIVMVGLFTLVTFISYLTGHNAVGYSLAAAAHKNIGQDEEPAKWNMAFWIILGGIVSGALYFIGGLKPLQTVSILTAYPLIPVIIIFCLTMLKMVREDFPHKEMVRDDDGAVYAELQLPHRDQQNEIENEKETE